MNLLQTHRIANKKTMFLEKKKEKKYKIEGKKI
jgi:hypothetical protein